MLNDKIEKLLSPNRLRGLHIYEGTDYSNQITVEHLLSHTSGLPDYFQAARKSKNSLMSRVLNGNDQKWDFDYVISEAKELGAAFPPSSGKALYSDTNYQILGEIIKTITGDSLEKAIDKGICKKIGQHKTYLYHDVNDSTPVPLNYKKTELAIPLAMSSSLRFS